MGSGPLRISYPEMSQSLYNYVYTRTIRRVFCSFYLETCWKKSEEEHRFYWKEVIVDFKRVLSRMMRDVDMFQVSRPKIWMSWRGSTYWWLSRGDRSFKLRIEGESVKYSRIKRIHISTTDLIFVWKLIWEHRSSFVTFKRNGFANSENCSW